MTPTVENEPRMPTASASPPNIGPRSAPATAALNAVPSTAPRCSFGAVLETHARAPAHVIVLENPCTKRAIPRVIGVRGECEGEARDGEKHEPGDDRMLGAESRRRKAARDPAEERPGPERADEQPGARLREVELVGVLGHERSQRRVQHRIDEDHRADEREQPPHANQNMQRGSPVSYRRRRKPDAPNPAGSGWPKPDPHNEMHRAGDAFVQFSD